MQEQLSFLLDGISQIQREINIENVVTELN